MNPTLTTIVAACIGTASCAALAAPIKVELQGEPGKWTLLRDGKPYFVKGAGGTGSLPLLVALGGNSTRTWGAENLDAQLDEAHRLGVSVTVGIWLEHPRHGFSYNDPKSVADQYELAKAAILKYKDHPAVLAWGIGNEMEGEGNDAAIWSAINNIASMAKRLDPAHPTMTVIAELGQHKVQNIHRLCPDIDIVGINAYGGGASVGKRYVAAGGSKPYILTEFGPNGAWECAKTPEGVPLEQTSTQKVDAYRRSYVGSVQGMPGVCFGSYAFLWGHKVEATTTWFGLLLPDGTRMAAADALSELWTGKPPANLCPTISEIRIAPGSTFKPGGVVEASIEAADPEGDTLKVEWQLYRDVHQYVTGGDPMDAPPEHPEALTTRSPMSVRVKLPAKPGVYRLYAIVRDGQGGGATATLPLISVE